MRSGAPFESRFRFRREFKFGLRVSELQRGFSRPITLKPPSMNLNGLRLTCSLILLGISVFRLLLADGNESPTRNIGLPSFLLLIRAGMTSLSNVVLLSNRRLSGLLRRFLVTRLSNASFIVLNLLPDRFSTLRTSVFTEGPRGAFGDRRDVPEGSIPQPAKCAAVAITTA